MILHLIKLANSLEKLGLRKESRFVDKLIKKATIYDPKTIMDFPGSKTEEDIILDFNRQQQEGVEPEVEQDYIREKEKQEDVGAKKKSALYTECIVKNDYGEILFDNIKAIDVLQEAKKSIDKSSPPENSLIEISPKLTHTIRNAPTKTLLFIMTQIAILKRITIMFKEGEYTSAMLNVFLIKADKLYDLHMECLHEIDPNENDYSSKIADVHSKIIKIWADYVKDVFKESSISNGE